MRLTRKKIEEVIVSILGEEGFSLIDELNGKENVSEFDLAKKTKKDIKIIRKMLYMLYNNNLVGFNRKKDKQKGWYIYYWTLIPDNIKFMYFKQKKEILRRLKQRLEEEQKELFFVCPKKCVRLNFDRAMDFEFHCPECGDLLAQDENKKNILEIEKRIKILKGEVAKEKLALRKKVWKEKKVKKKKKVVKEKTTKKKIVKRKPVKKKTVKRKPKAKKKVTKKKVVKKKETKKKIAKKKVTKKKAVKKKIVKKKVLKKPVKKKTVKRKTTKKNIKKKKK